MAVVAWIVLAPSAMAQLKLPGRGPAAVEPSDPSELARLSLVSDRDALVPGSTTWIGLSFKIHDAWHLYWRNNGDTGAPMTISIDAPEGVRVGEVQYPAPHWHPMPGGYVDFIYEDHAMLLVPVTLAPTPAAEGSVTLKATVDFLICKDVCLAGRADASIELPIRENAAPTPDAPRFAETRLRMPKPLSEARDAGVQTEWQAGRRLLIQAPGATSLTFFPYESPVNAYPEDVASSARATGERLILRYDDASDGAQTIGGVLEVRSALGTSWYEIVVPPPPTSLSQPATPPGDAR